MICTKCKIEKLDTEFYKDSHRKTGLRSICKSCEKKRHQQYRQVNKERLSTYHKQWREANKTKFDEYQKAYQADNKESIAQKKKCYREQNSHKVKFWLRRWRKNNTDKSKQYNRKRRALRFNNGHKPYSDNYIFERDGWRCGICGRKINKKLKWPNPLSASIDHIIPLSNGGSDSPVNLQATHLRCNQGKNNRNGEQLRLIR